MLSYKGIRTPGALFEQAAGQNDGRSVAQGSWHGSEPVRTHDQLLGPAGSDDESLAMVTCAVHLETILPHENPVILSGCQTHLLCRACAEVLPDKSCPTCRERFENLVPLETIRFAYRNYLNTRVKCPGGCGASMAISNLDGHFGTCEKVKCPTCAAAVKPPGTVEVGQSSERELLPRSWLYMARGLLFRNIARPSVPVNRSRVNGSPRDVLKKPFRVRSSNTTKLRAKAGL